MKKFIVTTTINKPTEATIKYSQKGDWTLIVVGDLKTPHDKYQKLNCIYLDPQEQEKKYKKLSDAIGWNSIQRRNVGFVEAYNLGADVIATVDDDNIPYESWGKDIYIGQEIECDLYEPANGVFDPLSVTKRNDLWHRGYPIELIPTKNNVVYKGKTKRKILIQADLWDGDPDIDAMARLSLKPIVKYDEIQHPYCSNKISPFNSQNTFLARETIPYYSVFPHVGRMDDIWGSYVLQYYFPDNLIYNKSSVYQDRNIQDLITNLEKEIIGYRNTFNILQNLSSYEKYLPKETKIYFDTYRSCF